MNKPGNGAGARGGSAGVKRLPVLALFALVIGVAVLQSLGNPSRGDRDARPIARADGNFRGTSLPGGYRVASGGHAQSQPSRAVSWKMRTRGEVGLPGASEPGGSEVSGIVLDAMGGSVPGASVALRGGAQSVPTLVSSDDEGRFKANVPAGEVEILARAEAFSTAQRRVFAPATGVTLVLVAGGQIIGRVIDADEQPVTGLTVTARGTHDNEELRLVTKSDAAGEFRVAGVPGGGSYEVMATGPTLRSDARQVLVEIGRSSDAVLLHVQRATTLTGLVQRAGQPCRDAQVSASGPSPAATRASALGVVRFDGLLPGSYRVAIYCSEALPFFESVELGDQPLHRDWSVLPGLSVQGTVLGPGGERVENASIGCGPLSESSERPSTTCVSSADGAFTCNGLAPGDYLCAVNDRGDPDREFVHVGLKHGHATGVILHTLAHARLAVSLVPAPFDMGAFRVFARGPSGFPLQAALEHGRFSFDALPFGDYEVYVELPTSGALARARLGQDSQLVSLELAAPEWRTIQGTVIDATGLPLVDGWVSASPSEPLARSSHVSDPPTLTNEHGEFTLSGLVAGAYDLQARSGGSVGERRAVAAGAGGIVVHMPAAIEASSGDFHSDARGDDGDLDHQVSFDVTL